MRRSLRRAADRILRVPGGPGAAEARRPAPGLHAAPAGDGLSDVSGAGAVLRGRGIRPDAGGEQPQGRFPGPARERIAGPGRDRWRHDLRVPQRSRRRAVAAVGHRREVCRRHELVRVTRAAARPALPRCHPARSAECGRRAASRPARRLADVLRLRDRRPGRQDLRAGTRERRRCRRAGQGVVAARVFARDRGARRRLRGPRGDAAAVAAGLRGLPPAAGVFRVPGSVPVLRGGRPAQGARRRGGRRGRTLPARRSLPRPTSRMRSTSRSSGSTARRSSTCSRVRSIASTCRPTTPSTTSFPT